MRLYKKLILLGGNSSLVENILKYGSIRKDYSETILLCHRNFKGINDITDPKKIALLTLFELLKKFMSFRELKLHSNIKLFLISRFLVGVFETKISYLFSGFKSKIFVKIIVTKVIGNTINNTSFISQVRCNFGANFL